MTSPAPDPLLRDVAETLHTARLELRCPRAGDGAAVHAAVVESLAELRAWPASLPWALSEPTLEATELYCRESHGVLRHERTSPDGQLCNTCVYPAVR